MNLIKRQLIIVIIRYYLKRKKIKYLMLQLKIKIKIKLRQQLRQQILKSKIHQIFLLKKQIYYHKNK